VHSGPGHRGGFRHLHVAAPGTEQALADAVPPGTEQALADAVPPGTEQALMTLGRSALDILG